MSTHEHAGRILDVIPRCMRALRTEMRSRAGKDLTVPQFRVLVKLAKGAATNSEVAEWLGVSTPTITRMLNGLVARGLVERIRSEQDRREVRLTLSARGRSRYEDVRLEVQSLLADKLEVLSPAKRDRLKAGLAILEELFT